MDNAVKRLFADIRELTPQIAARAAEIEAARRVPIDIVEALRSIGLFRMLVPRSHGGLELDLATATEAIAALARADGSLGWTAMIAAGGALFTPLAPRETYDEIYRDGPDVIFAGAVQPTGTAEATANGWRVSGRWAFASGCRQADWMLGFCVMTENGKPLPGPAGAAGPPLLKACLLPARDWEIEDTWHVAGLKGTGSHHISLRDKLVPAARFLDLVGGTPCVAGPLYGGVPSLLPLLHGAFGIGMAEGALADLVAHANTGRQQFRAAAPMRESEFFQAELGRIEAEVRAARALLQMQVASHWRDALAGTLNSEALQIQAAQSAAWIAAAAVRVTDGCFTLAGASAIYDSSPLQRRLRDMHTAAQHFVAQPRQFIGAGRQLLQAAAGGPGAGYPGRFAASE